MSIYAPIKHLQESASVSGWYLRISLMDGKEDTRSVSKICELNLPSRRHFRLTEQFLVVGGKQNKQKTRKQNKKTHSKCLSHFLLGSLLEL